MTFACRTKTPCPPYEATISTPGPARSTQGARMKTAGNGCGPSAGIESGTSADSTCRPNALRRTVTSIRSERLLIETGDVVRGDDHPHARSPERHAGADAFDDRAVEFEALEQADHGRRFPARDHERIDRGEIARVLHRARARSGPCERMQVLGHVPLDGEHADSRFHSAGLAPAWLQRYSRRSSFGLDRRLRVLVDPVPRLRSTRAQRAVEPIDAPGTLRRNDSAPRASPAW